MKTIVVFVLFFTGVITLRAQTKAIAYKSHSGSAANYGYALNTDPYLITDAGFGLPSHRSYHFIKEVRYLKRNTAVLVSAVYQGDFVQMKDTVFVQNMYDTVFNKSLFKESVTLDSLKILLQRKYHYDNGFEAVQFVGFDNIPKKANRNKSKNNKSVALIITEGNDVNPPNTPSAMTEFVSYKANASTTSGSKLPKVDFSLLLKMLLFSAIAGWLVWKLYRPLYKHSV